VSRKGPTFAVDFLGLKGLKEFEKVEIDRIISRSILSW
jgi:hypothetical protein